LPAYLSMGKVKFMLATSRSMSTQRIQSARSAGMPSSACGSHALSARGHARRCRAPLPAAGTPGPGRAGPIAGPPPRPHLRQQRDLLPRPGADGGVDGLGHQVQLVAVQARVVLLVAQGDAQEVVAVGVGAGRGGHACDHGDALARALPAADLALGVPCRAAPQPSGLVQSAG